MAICTPTYGNAGVRGLFAHHWVPSPVAGCSRRAQYPLGGVCAVTDAEAPASQALLVLVCCSRLPRCPCLCRGTNA
eukprot:364730-Chlamydomonas_euryale.AAC.5